MPNDDNTIWHAWNGDQRDHALTTRLFLMSAQSSGPYHMSIAELVRGAIQWHTDYDPAMALRIDAVY